MAFPSSPSNGDTYNSYYYDSNIASWRKYDDVGPAAIGSVVIWPGAVVPVGYLLCDGTAISRVTYNNLFAAIGTLWGVGDGSTTYNLPDLRGAFLRGTGSHGSENMADGNDFAGPDVGDFENDQSQGHHHGLFDDGLVDGLTGYDYGIGGLQTGGSGVRNAAGAHDPIEDDTNGTPRTGDETRPFNAGVNYIIRATNQIGYGTPLPTYSYSTGWTGPISDWTNAEVTVTHGLDTDMTDLIVKVFLADDADGLNSIELSNNRSNTGGSDWGNTLHAISDSQFKFQTATLGFEHIADSGGSRQIDSETRYIKINVYKPEVLASEISTTMYDTDWITSFDFTDATYTITHNLGASLDELLVQVLIKRDAGSVPATTAINVAAGSTQLGSSGRFGQHLEEVDSNSVIFQTAFDGAILLTDTGSVASITTGELRVIFYKPEMISTATLPQVKSIISDYTIADVDSEIFAMTTGNTNRTVTMPLLANGTAGEEYEITKADDGTGYVTMACSASDTLKLDGVTSAELLFSQYNTIQIRHMGSFWRIVELSSNGSNSDGEFQLHADGTQDCWINYVEVSLAVTSVKGNIFSSTVDQVWTFPLAFLNSDPTVVGNILGLIGTWFGGSNTAGTATTFPFRILYHTSTTASWRVFISAKGRWRT